MSDFDAPDAQPDSAPTPFMSLFLRQSEREHQRLRDRGLSPVTNSSLSSNFVSFLQVASRFDVFAFGPISIYVPAVREVLDRHQEAWSRAGKGGDPDGSYREFTVLAEAERRRSGAPELSELHMLLAFMKVGAGLPAKVFGELGVSPEAVEEFARFGAPARNELERLYSAEEAARYLDVHAETVREWIRTGRLRASRVAGSRRALRIKASDLAAVLEPVETTSPDDDAESG